MIRCAVLCYVAGALSVLALAYRNPDAAVQLGLKLAAFQSHFTYDAVPTALVETAAVASATRRAKGSR